MTQLSTLQVLTQHLEAAQSEAQRQNELAEAAFTARDRAHATAKALAEAIEKLKGSGHDFVPELTSITVPAPAPGQRRDLTDQHDLVLRHIREAGVIRLAALAEKSGLGKADVAASVVKLRRSGAIDSPTRGTYRFVANPEPKVDAQEKAPTPDGWAPRLHQDLPEPWPPALGDIGVPAEVERHPAWPAAAIPDPLD